MEKNCKKALMGIAALLIVIFHFYVPFSGNAIEQSFAKAAYIGVDIFFFLSAYSMSDRKRLDYRAFIKNRLINVYGVFVIFAVIAAIYKGWKIKRFIQVITGIELFYKGGGSFLWYLPAIMIVYFLGPVFIFAKEKMGKAFVPLMLVIWAILVVVLERIFDYTSIFILLNRMPIYFFGMCYGEFRIFVRNKKPEIIFTVGMLVGTILIYYFAGIKRLNTPIQEIYYVIAIPFTLSIVSWFDLLWERYGMRTRLLGKVGEITLEIYGLQMIFGFDMERKLIKLTKNGQISFVLTIFGVILLSYIFYKAKLYIIKFVLNGDKNIR